MKKIIIYVIVAILFTACGSTLNVNEKITKEENHIKSIYTNYVSTDYSKKDEGYDWVMVSLKEIDTHKARVSIKSRADKKKPTCTFDDIVYKKDNNQFVSYKDEKTILFEVKDDYLFIKGESKTDENFLYYFCSGGATLKGEYKRLNENIDKNQIDKISYSNTLTYGKYTFFINQKNNVLSIFSPDLKYSNKAILEDIEGEIIYSEISDLNSDSYPEVYIYTNISKNGKIYANTIAYSVNGGVSMSNIYLASLAYDKKNFENYQGGDEFRVVENRLIRRFPIKNNKTKQIQYKLIQGEASWQLKIDKIIEY